MNLNHTSTRFDAQLEQLRAEVLRMGGAVEDQLSLAVQTLQSGGMYLIEQVLNVEHQINALEMEIDGLCTNVIARRAPVAIDLREMLTYMMEDPRTISATLDIIFIAKALERAGDHAKNISEYVVYMIKGKDVRHLSAEELTQALRS